MVGISPTAIMRAIIYPVTPLCTIVDFIITNNRMYYVRHDGGETYVLILIESGVANDTYNKKSPNFN